jgi:MerR family transcriptional regulator, thiopeptide resistance regulator
MDQPLDISQVIRRTGLTARALRFYEGRGLVRPLRTASGRRLYGSGELQRLNQIVVLKAAGFSLADIGRLLDRKPVDIATLITAQIDALAAQARSIAEARTLLLSAKSRIDRGEPLDAATLCSLIRSGTTMMEPENWKSVTARYFSAEEQAEWSATMKALPAGFDAAAYGRRWTELGARIEAHLPLDPAAPEAQAFFDEWQALIEPFKAVATPTMLAGVTRLYDRMPEWQDEMQPAFSAETWALMKAVAARQRVGTGSAPE